MACGIIGENAESAVERRKVRGGRFIQSDEVNAGRDHATREGPAMMTTSPSEERER